MSFESTMSSINSLLPSLNSNCFSFENIIETSQNKASHKENASINNNKSIRLHIDKKTYLYFTPDRSFLSLSAIIPVNKYDLLFQLYKLDNLKEKIEKQIKIFLGEKKCMIKEKLKSKKYKKNDVIIEKKGNDIIIIDNHFINDCMVLSKSNTNDCAFNICNKISDCLFDVKISFQYLNKQKENLNLYVAKIKLGTNAVIYSDPYKNKNEAKLDALKKFIKNYLPQNYSEEIIKNVIESIKNAEKNKNARKNKFEKYLEIFGGDRKLLRKKRNLTFEEFNKRLPYFYMLDKDKKKKNNYLFFDEEFDAFINTENFPIDKILLGDPNIVDNHLQDFTYTPFKLFEMVRDTEKNRGIDFKIEYGSNNDTDFCHTNEATIFSQKMGIKVQGYGKSKEEAENKCALSCLSVLFRDKFKTYYELHNYFKKKNGKYLDIILLDDKNKKEENETLKKKKIDENIEIINLINEEENNTCENIIKNGNEVINIIDDENENKNGDFIDEGISEINKICVNANKSSSSDQSSVTSNQIIKALSNHNDNNNLNVNNSEIFGENSISISANIKNDEEEQIDDLFYI